MFRYLILLSLLLSTKKIVAFGTNSVTDLPQKFVFPSRIQIFKPTSFYSPQASFLQIRHANRSICSLNAMGNATFPCRCFGFPSENYELLIDNTSKFGFSVISEKKFLKVPENSSSCQPLNIAVDPDIFCDGLNLLLVLQYSPVVDNMITRTDDLYFATELEMELKKSLTIPCEHLCLPGIYRIALISDGQIVQSSNPIKIQQSEEISINLPRPHIFPRCFDYLKITWTNLSCPVQELEFKMRLFAVPEGSNFDRSYYVEEYDIDLSEQALELPCYQFDIIYAQFCFQIVSVQKRTARFNDWGRRCVYTENLAQIDGGWRAWSAWSPCSATCGHGQQRRWRLCDSPAPQNGGNLCEGELVEFLQCTSRKCTEVKTVSVPHYSLCSCGCILNEKAGVFFASSCGNTSDWILKSHGRFLNLKLKNKLAANDLRLAIYRGSKKEELLYDSLSNSGLENSFYFTSEDCFVISVVDLNSSLNTSSGFEISYEWNNESKLAPPWTSLEMTTGCVFCHPHLVLSLFTLLATVIIITPPFLCVYITLLFARKAAQRKRNRRQFDMHCRFDMDMLRSGETESTEVKSNKTVVTKRSIGIQLSASSTPRFPRYRGIYWSRATNSPQMTPRNGGHSSLSFSTDHDLEYDYYEPAVPGSFLTPATEFNFYSEIDIDQIIGSSELSRSIISRHDAHTQIDDT